MAALQQAYVRACGQRPAGDPVRMQAAEAVAMAGGDAVAWLNLAFEHFAGWRFGHGHAALAESLRRDPGLLAARWLHFQFPEAPSPADEDDAERFRQRWEAGVAAFEAMDFRQPALRAQVFGCIGSAPAFYRHYVDDAVAAAKRYGRLVHRMMAALDPGEPARAMRSGRRRILFVSPNLFQHTVARLFLPLIEDLDAARFDVHLAHLGAESDAMTARARAAGTFHAGPRAGPQWRQLFAELAPDVIVYLDIGMHPLPQVLAALRLAPVQCVLWGHPVTTGLPTIDWFISADALEPADAQDHYSERLLRLPGLGNGLEPPAAAAAPPAPGTNLLCAQSVFKLMPAQDALFARVLAALPAARLHLIPHFDAGVRAGLLDRLRSCLAGHGIDADRRVVMHGYQPLDGFLALADGCAVNLDSIGWSGGMSGMDLLRRGLPTVTLPGRTLRSRQTAVLLERMGVAELIARDEADWCAKAIALAGDPGRRQDLSGQLRQAAPAALDDRAASAAALAEFLATCGPA
ncbi:MAG: hypothetical protein KF823_07515 [Xanthomonadales bacterium]|nr:hypothetical protein [Xanthomonadales bacterium]